MSNVSVLDKYSEQIVVLTIENGSKNLLSEPEFIRQDVLMDWLADNSEIQVLIITRTGRYFSVGADVSALSERSAAELSQMESGEIIIPETHIHQKKMVTS